MSVDTSAVRDEVEEMQERERIAWRVSCRRERERAKEREVQSEVSTNCTEVVATVGRGAVGDGRQSALGWRGGDEVCSFFVLLANATCFWQLFRPSAPDYKTYIFGIALQFLTIWLEKMMIFFHLILTSLRHYEYFHVV